MTPVFGNPIQPSPRPVNRDTLRSDLRPDLRPGRYVYLGNARVGLRADGLGAGRERAGIPKDTCPITRAASSRGRRPGPRPRLRPERLWPHPISFSSFPLRKLPKRLGAPSRLRLRSILFAPLLALAESARPCLFSDRTRLPQPTRLRRVRPSARLQPPDYESGPHLALISPGAAKPPGRLPRWFLGVGIAPSRSTRLPTVRTKYPVTSLRVRTVA